MTVPVPCKMAQGVGLEYYISPSSRRSAALGAGGITIITIIICFIVAGIRVKEGEAWFLNVPYPYVSLSGQDNPQYTIFVTGLSVAAILFVIVSYSIYCWLETFRASLPAEDAEGDGWPACCWRSWCGGVGNRDAEWRSAVWISVLYCMSAVCMVTTAVTNYRPILNKDKHYMHTQSANALFVFMTWGYLIYVWHMDVLTTALSKPPGSGERGETDAVCDEDKCKMRPASGAKEVVGEADPPPPGEVTLERKGAGRAVRRAGALLIIFLAVCYVGIGDTWMKSQCVKRDITEMTMQECVANSLSEGYCEGFRKPGNTTKLYLLDLAKLGDSCIAAITFHAVSQHLLVLTVLVVHMCVFGWDLYIDPPLRVVCEEVTVPHIVVDEPPPHEEVTPSALSVTADSITKLCSRE